MKSMDKNQKPADKTTKLLGVLFGAAAKRIPLWSVGLLQFVAPSLQFLLGVFVFGEALGTLRLARCYLS